MEQNTGDIGIFNPAKEVAREVTLDVLIRHRDAIRQAREGVIRGETPTEEPSDYEKKINRVRGLSKMISAQRDMISISRPIVRFRCHALWKKNHSTEESQEKSPFEKQENDYTELNYIALILKEAEMDIIQAEQTESTKDDYILEKKTHRGTSLILTEKYFDMLNGLEDTYEKIYLIMLKNKIVSAGIEEDEVRSYKEQEQEAIRRVIEA